jgi:type IV secretory pathway VirB4 component
MLVLGKLSRGKSSLVKSYIYRQLLFGREAWVLDPKGEYGPLAEAVGGTQISLAPGGEVRVNPITRRGGSSSQLSLLRSVVKAALRRELDPEEDAGLRVALETVDAEAGPCSEPTLPDVVEALLHPRACMVEAISAASTEAFAAANRNAALALQRLCAGDLRGMFDGPTTPGLDLDASLVVLDLSAVQDSSALAVLMACAGAWLQAILLERKRAAEAEGLPGKQMIFDLDEAWRVAKLIGVAEWLQSSYKLSRSLGVQSIAVTHRPTDFGAVGSAGSREARILEGLIADSDTIVLFAQSPDEVGLVREKFGLSATEAELLPSLRRGEALWIVGQHSGLAQLRLSTTELTFCDTDARMAA